VCVCVVVYACLNTRAWWGGKSIQGRALWSLLMTQAFLEPTTTTPILPHKASCENPWGGGVESPAHDWWGLIPDSNIWQQQQQHSAAAHVNIGHLSLRRGNEKPPPHHTVEGGGWNLTACWSDENKLCGLMLAGPGQGFGCRLMGG